jgi:MFS transporter, DHA1 family, multidrug resistance protein
MPSEIWKRNLIALSVAQIVTQIGFSFVFPFTPLYVQSLGVSGIAEAAQWAGAIGAAMAVAMAISQPFWGSLADRIGHRPMVLRAMVGGAATIAAQGLVTAPWQLVMLRFVQGLVIGSVPASNALISTSTPKERLGFALGLMQVGILAGTALGPLVGGVLADSFDYRTAFFVCGAALLVAAAVVFAFCQEAPRSKPSSGPRPGMWTESRALLALPFFSVVIGIIFLTQLAQVIVMPVLSLFIADLSDSTNPATIAGIVLAVTGATSAVAALWIGRVTDRGGARRWVPVCLLGSTLTYVPQAFVQQVWQLLALRALLGAFIGGLATVNSAMVAELVPPDKRGAAFGFTATASSLAGIVGPLAGAAITTGLGVRAVFVATGALLAVSLIWVTLALGRSTEPRPAPG